MERDLYHNTNQESSVDPLTITGNGTTVGNIIDTYKHESLIHELIMDITDGDYSFVVEQGEDAALADAAAVPADEVFGNEALVGQTGVVTKAIGVMGKARYQRLSIVQTGATTGAVTSGIAVKGHFRHADEANRP